MSTIREKITNMFLKITAGTITREEGTMLLNHLVKENPKETVKEAAFLIDHPPQNVFSKTVLHTVALTRNKAFFNLIVVSLENRNEDVSILAAEELARQRSGEARNVLTEHLLNEAYHVRKASSIALAKGFGKEGLEILKSHILTHKEQFFRTTSAVGLLSAGEKGVTSLLDLLESDDSGAIITAADALGRETQRVKDEDMPKMIDSLMRAGDRKDAAAILALLKTIAMFRGRAKRFEDYVLALKDYPFEMVRSEAQKTVKMINS